MKHLFVGISFFCLSLCSVNAQESSISNIKHEMSFAVSGCTTPLLTKIFFGGSIDMKYYPTHRWGTGLDFSGAQKIINNTYNFDMGTPIINYYEIGWLNQYDFIQTEKFRIGATLNNGIAISVLGDNDDKVEKNGRYGKIYVPRKIASNYLYIVEPGFEASYCLYSEKHHPDFYLTTQAKYRFAFGGTKYADLSDFNGSFVGLGLSIIGFVDDEPKHINK